MNWFRLKFLENKLAFGEFGKHKKFLRLCHERKATRSADRVKIAQEVLNGPAINSLESWAHALYLKAHGS